MISKNTIDKVFEVMRVEEVISDFVQLKRSGSNYKGLSPFSSERTPSFMVSPVKQIWKDFSSGKGGTAITFLMEHEHFTYPEAIRYLANKYHIEIEETELDDQRKEEIQERESMYLVSEYAQRFFQRTLTDTESGKSIGLPYFKERGFTDATIEKFKLGYSPDQWSAFTDDALSQGYRLEFLEKTGLTIVKEEGRYLDRFKGRVMFPIHSMSGRVLGFGGRTLQNDKKVAKYLNSPESEIYHKSKVLYGIYFAKHAIAKADNCYLAEGYTDVIQMHQSGIENVVSSSGTALTIDQILLLRRLTPNITLLFDADPAGLRAALRGVDLILEQGMNVRVCTFPQGEDPDSFAKTRSREEIEEYLKENTQDFIRFKASLLVESSQGDPIAKAEVIRDMVKSISKVQDSIQRELYVRECSKIMEVSESVIFAAVTQILEHDKGTSAGVIKKSIKQIAPAPISHKPVDRATYVERELLKCVLLYGDRIIEFEEDQLLFDKETQEIKEHTVRHRMPIYEKCYLELQEDEMTMGESRFRSIIKEVLTRYHSGGFELSSFLRELEAEVMQELSSVIMEDETRQLHDWQRRDIVVKSKEHDLSEQVIGCILNLRLCYIEKRIKEIRDQMTEERTETSQKKELLFEVMDYIELQKRLFKRLRRVVN